jgi:hypothetical protein
MRPYALAVTFLFCSLILAAIIGDAITSARGAPVVPDWKSVITETRQRLGPVRPMQTCVDYSEQTLAICRERGLDCREVSFSCGFAGHSVVVGRYTIGNQQLCSILDATNRAEPDSTTFVCEEMREGWLRPSSIYCDGASDCRCKILDREQVYKNSDPASFAAVYRPTPLRNIFGALSRCISSCQEQSRTHEQEAAVIRAGCNGEAISQSQQQPWGLQSWLSSMSRQEKCAYSVQYGEEARQFHQQCVASCNSFEGRT